jgi:hypothetical protein
MSPLNKIQGLDWLVKEQANEDTIAAAIATSAALMAVASDAENITGTSDVLACTPGTMMAALAGLAFPIGSSSTVTATDTIATAALSTVRAVHGAIILTGTGGTTIISGSVAGTRGVVTLSGTNTAGGAYLYGAQGKIVITGTLNHADSRVAPVIAQLDCTGGTVSAGEMSGVWIDTLGVTGIPFAEFNAIRISSNKDCKFTSLVYAQSDASFVFDWVIPTGGANAFVATAGTGSGSAGAATGVATKVFLIRSSGTTYYVPMFLANT